MRRRSLGLLLTAGPALVAACDGPGAPPMTSLSMSTGRLREPVAPIVRGPGAVDLGLKWNTFLEPPLTYAASLGSGVTFTEVEWCAIRDLAEPQQFSATDRALDQANGYGFGLMIKLRVGDSSGAAAVAEPDEEAPKHPSTAPDDPERYRAWVVAMVRRYQPRGVRFWAVENEVDAANFWSGTPQAYADLVRLVSAAIRSVDPSAVVLDAGISSTGYGIAIAGELLDAGREEEALAYYTAYYRRRQEAGASRFPPADTIEALRSVLTGDRAARARAMVAANWEAVNGGAIGACQLHFYEDPVVLPRLLQYVDDHLEARIPVQAWEIGTAWPGASYTPEAHAAEVVRVVGGLLARRISPIVYLPLAFTPRSGKVQVFRGLVSPEGEVLPAGVAFKRMATAAAASAAVVPVVVGSGVSVSSSVAGASSLGSSSAGSSPASTAPAAGGGAVLVGTGSSLGLLWTATGDPTLLDLPGGRDAALAAATTALGEPVTAAG